MVSLMSKEKNELVKIGKEVYEKGLVAGTWGNISRRLEDNPNRFAITPSGVDYREMLEKEMVVLNLDGEKIEGERKPSTESPLHTKIYSNREDIGGILHTHSIFATSVACTKRDIPPIVEDMAQLVGGSIETAEYELPGTEELAKSAVEALDDKNAVLLANHGAVALGRDLNEALKTAEIVEKSAKIYLFAKLVGEPKELEEDDVKLMREFYLEKYKP